MNKMVRTAKNVVKTRASDIDRARAVNGKRTEWTVEGAPGLILLVLPSGIGTYYYRYKVKIADKWKKRYVKIGRRDELDWQAAVKRAAVLHGQVANDRDPVAEEQNHQAVEARKAADEKAKAAQITLQELFEIYAVKNTQIAARTMKDYRHALERDVFQKLGALAADEITPQDIAAVLEVVEDRSKNAAHRCRSALGSVYRWALKQRKVLINPTVGLGFIHKAPARVYKGTDDDIAKLWNGIDDADGRRTSEQIRLVLKITLLLGQRCGEVAGARISELHGLDTDKPIWVIDERQTVRGKIVEGRMKSGKRQTLPLPRQVAELFKQAIEAAKPIKTKYPEIDRDIIFPADFRRLPKDHRAGQQNVRVQSVSNAMRRLRKRVGVNDIRVHDLRKAITTNMAEAGVRPDAIDKIIDHAAGGGSVTATHYNFAKLEAPIRTALQNYADHIWTITGHSVDTSSNVIALKG